MPTIPTFHQFLQTIATNLHAARVSKNLSIAAVAKAVKTSPAILRRVEKGEHNLRIELLERLCKFYEISAGEVATEVPQPVIQRKPRSQKPEVRSPAFARRFVGQAEGNAQHCWEESPA